MAMTQETYTRQQGLRKTYDIEYSSMRYKISQEGKTLKQIELPLSAVNGGDTAWAHAVADIEYLRGMPEE